MYTSKSYITKSFKDISKQMDELLDFDSIPFSVGFEDIFNDLKESLIKNTKTNFPSYDLIKSDNDSYILRIAIAGYDPKDVKVQMEHNELSIIYDKEESIDENFVHHGITQRSFKRQFLLNNDLEVKEVTYKNGLLEIKLTRTEAKNTIKTFEIKTPGENNV